MTVSDEIVLKRFHFISDCREVNYHTLKMIAKILLYAARKKLIPYKLLLNDSTNHMVLHPVYVPGTRIPMLPVAVYVRTSYASVRKMHHGEYIGNAIGSA